MTPKEVLEKWIDCFNASDVEGIAALYADDAVNHQVANAPVAGKEAIRRMFAGEFATAKMVCIVENIFEDGEWAILERPIGVAWLRLLPYQKQSYCISEGLLGQT